MRRHRGRPGRRFGSHLPTTGGARGLGLAAGLALLGAGLVGAWAAGMHLALSWLGLGPAAAMDLALDTVVAITALAGFGLLLVRRRPSGPARSQAAPSRPQARGPRGPIAADELLDLHQALAQLQGPLTELWAGPPAGGRTPPAAVPAPRAPGT